MATTIYKEADLPQGSTEWLQARCGLVTASTVGALVSKSIAGAIEFNCPNCSALGSTQQPCQSKPNKDGETRGLKTIHPERIEKAKGANVIRLVPSDGDMAHTLMNTLIAERITGRVDPIPTNRAMERGTLDEPYARAVYAEHYDPVTEVGFIVNDDHGFKMGYSPDGLVGDDGLIEIKSRSQRIQLQTVLRDEVPAGNMAQLQMGMLVTGRKWCDYISYSGGMALYVKRVYPDPEWFAVILEAVSAFENTATETISQYLDAVANRPATEYIDHFADELGVTF